jgi:DNA repair exonuclease SbcCD ATPase subunit
MSCKISKLELENVKRVRAVEITPAQIGLTTIGGRNFQGKTSILDAIAYALGGEKYRPSNLQREGSSAEANIRVTMSNGLLVERSGKNAALKVIDPSGARAGQRLLDSFVEELALNLPKFMGMKNDEKARVLLSILGIEDQLKAIDAEEKAAYDERTMQGRIADQKEKYAAEMPEWHDVPEEPLTPSALVAESQHIMARNARKANMRANLRNYETLEMKAWELAKAKDQRIAELKVMLTQAEKEYAEALQKAKDIHNEGESARSIPIDEDESTAEVERKLAELEEINSKVRANADKQKAIDDAENARQKYIVLTATVEEVRAKRRKLLESIKLPLPGLGVENGELVYNGQKWDCMSGMEQIKVAVAIIRQRKPECGFILLDKIEAFDLEQLAALSEWLKSENLQAIATRVSTGEECSIIIEDGLVVAAQNDDQELDW